MAHCRLQPKVSVLYTPLFMGVLFGLIMANSLPHVPQCSDLNGPHCIYIDPQNGTYNSNCLNASKDASIPCKQLSWVLNATYQSNNTVYVLSSGTHAIAEPLYTFQNAENITFVGDGILNTNISCTAKDVGLAFVGSANLVFSNLSIFNCGAPRNSTSKTGTEHFELRKIWVALYFYLCKNLTMSYVNVSHSPNATGVVVYDTVGNNTVSNSVFSHNKAFNGRGGGGFYVEFTYCIPGDNNCSADNATSHIKQNHDSSYAFKNCMFVSNVAILPESENLTYFVPYLSNHIAVGRGGGLSIFFKGEAHNNSVTVQQCLFESNVASWGAGLFVEFHDNSIQNDVHIELCNMVWNQCPFKVNSGTAGGGMRLGHYVFGKGNYFHQFGANHISITRSTFSNNTAFNGGGLSISPTVQNVSVENTVAKILINNCTFTRNIARLGAALQISRFAMILDGDILSVVISDCEFISNSADYIKILQNEHGIETKAFQPGLGAVYVNQVPVSFNGTAGFYQNNDSALVAIGTALDFTNCLGKFYGNRGKRGGAIALLGLAWLKVDDLTNLVLANNLATADGGAIYNKYIERENLITYGNCFIRHTDYGKNPKEWGSYFAFYSNYDQNGDRLSAIHSTSISPCAWAGGTLVNTDLREVFCWNASNWVYYPIKGNCSSHIHSDIGNVVFTGSSNTVKAFPGSQFQVPLSLTDDLHHTLSHDTLFSTTLNYDNGTHIDYVFSQEATISGDQNSSHRLFLDSLEDRDWHIIIEVNLADCPPGFAFNKSVTNQTYKNCKCMDKAYSGAVFCDPQQTNAYLNNNYWMGSLNEHDGYVVGLCPPNYCFSNTTQPLPNTSVNLENHICGKYKRENISCGRCIDNFAVAVNSPNYRCVNCSDENLAVNRLKYFAAVYIPLTVLFSLIIIFNIRLTSAPANAFIIFGQLVAGTFDLSADGQIPFATFAGKHSDLFITAYKAIYGIFNLEFFEQFLDPFCIGELETLSVIALDYAVALFPLIMIIFVILKYKILSRCYRCMYIRCQTPGRCIPMMIHYRIKSISASMVPAFAAFFLLSYNKFSMVSSFLVGSQPLVVENGTDITSEEGLRVYYDGSYSFYDRSYRLYYLTPACIVFTTFVAIPPLLLLDFPVKAFEKLLSKVGFLWWRYPVDKVHILLDTFQGCFKNRMRFFAGLYFLFRLAINTSYNLTNTWFDQYLMQQIACVVMIVLLLVCQPYNKENWVFNVIDPLIFLNLVVLNAISFYFLSVTSASINQLPDNSLFLIQCILLLIPLIYMLSYIIWYLTQPYKKRMKRMLLSLKAKLFKKDRQIVGYQIIGPPTNASSEPTEENSYDSSSEDEVLLKRAQSRNTYRPQHTSTLVGIDEMEDETATIQTRPSIDSGLRTSSNEGYGSTGNSIQSNHAK